MNDLVKKLAWDSEFFGFNVAQIIGNRLTAASWQTISAFCAAERIALLQFKCDSHSRESIVTAEENGFHFADVRMTFEQRLDGTVELPLLPEGIRFASAQEKDIPALCSIAGDIYQHSRYYFDRKFDRDKVQTFYRDWVRKAVTGEFDDTAYCLFDDETPFAFCTVRGAGDRLVYIGLVGMDPRYAGRRLARGLMQHTFAALQQRRYDLVEVVTQGRNYPAQRFYQKADFLIKHMEIYYHKWFDR